MARSSSKVFKKKKERKRKGCSQFMNLKSYACAVFDKIYPLFLGEDPYLDYLLFTRSNPHDACDFRPNETAIKKCKFNPEIPTKVVIHGWIPNIGILDHEFRDNLLEDGNYNVVLFNWTAYSSTYNYTKFDSINYSVAALRSVYAALKLSSWIHYLQDHLGIDLTTFHFIAHSMGAQLTSLTSKTICGVKRVTYLDAAAPLFRYLPGIFRPTNNDADFVEEIHTGGALTAFGGYGYVEPFADIDFYPNGGELQPNCAIGKTFQTEYTKKETVEYQVSQESISCNHVASYYFYVASFNKTCKFMGLICDSYEDYTSGKCSRKNATVCQMGFYTKRIPGLPVRSKCYFKTAAKSPFCLN